MTTTSERRRQTDRLLYKIGQTLPDFLDATVPTAKGRCILATALAIELLRRHSVPAEPMSVQLRIVNTAWIDWMDAGQLGGTGAAFASGVYLLEAGHPEDPLTGLRTETGWHGHLVVHIPKTLRAPARLVDYDLRPMRRPAKQLLPPDWAVVDLGETTSGFAFFETGAAYYKLKPEDTSWQVAGDWTKRDTYGPMVDVLNQLISGQ